MGEPLHPRPGGESALEPSAPTAAGLPVSRLDPAVVAALVDRAIDRYLAGCHARVDAFVECHFSLRGALRLHRHALGWDLLRAPANAALIGVFVVMQLTAAVLPVFGLRRAGRWMASRAPFLTTDVARALTWDIQTELFDLPFEDRDRRWTHDALAVEIVRDPALAPIVASAAAVSRSRLDPADLARLIGAYADARNAAADLFNNVVFAGAGAAAFQQLTPGALSLGPLIAAAIAHQAAVATFPLGAGLGSLWYGVFAVEPSGAAIAASTAGLIGIAAVLTAFVGIVTDPVLRGLGVHRRRLHRLIDTLGHRLRGKDGAAFQVRDYYVARVFDLVDVVRTGLRATG
jgi:hypothetical protein